MTSFRQIEANRRNAAKSTGPVTETGKERSRRNAVRHGLTAETVIAVLEDTEDYKRFEVAVTADFTPETAVERELILRLAGLLWRLRRAASIETGMFETSTNIVVEGEQAVGSARDTFADTRAQFETLRSPVTGRPIRSEPALNKPATDRTSLANDNDYDRTGKSSGEDTDSLSDLAG